MWQHGGHRSGSVSSSYQIDVKHCFRESKGSYLVIFLFGSRWCPLSSVTEGSKIFSASTEIDSSCFCRENTKLNCCFSKTSRTSKFWLRMTRVWFIYMIAFSRIKQAKHKYRGAKLFLLRLPAKTANYWSDDSLGLDPLRCRCGFVIVAWSPRRKTWTLCTNIHMSFNNQRFNEVNCSVLLKEAAPFL